MSAELEAGRARRRLAEQQRELRAQLADGAASWIVPRFVSGSAVGLGLTLLLPAALGGGLGGLWARLLGPIVAAGVMTPLLYWRARQQSRRTIDELVEQADADLSAQTGPGWVGRTIRQGLLLAAGIGVPVGALLAFGSPVDELPAGSRLLGIGTFVLMSAAWTLPVSFGLRWVAVRSHGRLRGPRAVE